MLRKVYFSISWTITFFAALSITFLFGSTPAKAMYPIDFGGRTVYFYYTCTYPPAMQVQIYEMSSKEIMSLMYFPGTSAQRQYGPPYIEDQAVLGKTTGVPPCLTPCYPYGNPCPCNNTYSYTYDPLCEAYGFLVTPVAGSSGGPAF